MSDWDSGWFDSRYLPRSPFVITYYYPEVSMAQAPTKTYTDTLLDLADLTYKARLRRGESKATADAAAMRAVVARVKEDIQEELRKDRWDTAAAILDLWASERGIPLTEEKA